MYETHPSNLLRQDFGATTPNIRLDPDPRQPPAPPQPPFSPPPPGVPPKRGIPPWVWAALGGGLLIVAGAAALVVYILIPDPGFTLVIRGAPPNSDVLVDTVRRGTTALDGTTRVSSLKAGRRIVQVTHEGYEPHNASVTGEDGDEKSMTVSMAKIGQTQISTADELAAEIDYGGPMMLVAQGEFEMGSDKFNAEEKPAHKVTLPDFYIDKFEVTNEQYRKFCDETRRPYPTDPWWSKKIMNVDDYFRTQPRMPVVGVSWEDAAAYAKWAGKRLPSEAEWEKAASWDPQAAQKRQWAWGDARDAGRAHVGADRPRQVGQTPGGASAYGVQDMAGNVAEWVNDHYQAYPGNNVNAAEFGTKFRVVRGDSFRGSLDGARTTRRFHVAPQFTAAEKAERSWLIGFRCAVSADDPQLQKFLQGASRTQ